MGVGGVRGGSPAGKFQRCGGTNAKGATVGSVTSVEGSQARRPCLRPTATLCPSTVDFACQTPVRISPPPLSHEREPKRVVVVVVGGEGQRTGHVPHEAVGIGNLDGPPIVHD